MEGVAGFDSAFDFNFCQPQPAFALVKISHLPRSQLDNQVRSRATLNDLSVVGNGGILTRMTQTYLFRRSAFLSSLLILTKTNGASIVFFLHHGAFILRAVGRMMITG